MSRVHLIAELVDNRIVTTCGKAGYATTFPGEFDTATCDRFEADHLRSKATCKTCLRISGAKIRPLPKMPTRTPSKAYG